MKAISLTLLVSLLFTGCFTLRPATHEYTILPSYTAVQPIAQPIDATVKISATRSIPSLSSTQFYYLKGSSNISAYLYSRWSDTPSNMIDRSLYSMLQNQHLFTALVPAASSATADLVLESDLNAFYHRFHDGTNSEGFIDITYRLIDPKTKKTMASKRFVITEPSPSEDASGGVVALNHATHELSNQCISWLSINLKENTWKK